MPTIRLLRYARNDKDRSCHCERISHVEMTEAITSGA
jgi:hypothetical protein